MSSPSDSSQASLRRSRRSRRPAHTVYDDAAELLSSAEKDLEKKGNKRKQVYVTACCVYVSIVILHSISSL